MKKLTLFFAFQALCFISYAQNTVFCSEGFSSVPPAGWSTDTLASHWVSSNSTHCGGPAPECGFNRSPQTNATTRLISPYYDLSGITHLKLDFTHALIHYSGAYTVGVATRTGTGAWNTVWSVVNPTANTTGAISLTITNADLGSSNFQFCLFFSGNSYNINAWLIDNVLLYEPCAVDAKMAVNNVASYIAMGNINITGTVKNFGYSPITALTVNYMVDAEPPQSTVFTGLNLAAGANYNFTYTPVWSATPGVHSVKTWVSGVNSAGPDCSQTNDSLTKNISVATQTTTRKPAFEEFTSSTCGPCASFNSGTFTPFYTAHGTEFSLIKYQMNWPGNGDPYYTAEGGTRRTYYGVTSVPMLYIDGKVSGQTSAAMLSILNSEKAKATFFAISNFSPTYSGNIISVPLTITPYVSGIFKVHVIIVEKTTTGNVSTNGETSFKHVMMDMITGGSGLTVSFNAENNYTHTFTSNLTNAHVEEMSDLMVVVMIQENTTKEIFQSAEMDVTYAGIDETSAGNISIYPNPAYENITISNAGNADMMLYDIFGKLIMSENNINNNYLLNVSELSEGTYILKIANGEHIFTRKIAVIK